MTLEFPLVNLFFDQPTTVAIKQIAGKQTKITEPKQYDKTSKSASIALELLHPLDDQPLLLELHVNPGSVWSTTYIFQIKIGEKNAKVRLIFADHAPFIAEEGQSWCTIIDRKDEISSSNLVA